MIELFVIRFASLVGLIDKYNKEEYFNSSNMNYNILFGGGKTVQYAVGLALVGAGAFVFNITIHHFRKAKQIDTVQEPVQQPVMI
ncbi:hypothetical protein JNUCC31_01835 [Paenibacillus sp. JNUCC31]|uniref:hypothetical protein n=1 Tax=Paenibacillus sp. JNUCC-31 TaxID=2777983 RepID=UPI001786436F|nr:hypothetical protein [Paenibacillus sp. JNUCC-31]QOS79720.1 hypothetical protein JNUCC31_01835 [Paenibacillus sp. JNUCC-31]